MTPRHGSMLRSTARWAAFGAIPMISAGGLMQGGCLVTEHCFADSDCTAPKLCAPDGTCQFACSTDDDCGDGMGCVERRCRPRSVQPIACPQDMVNVADAFCVDRYEASRPDATRSNPGSIETRAVSRQGVMPWRLVPPASNAQARAACQTAGKDLCTPHQWRAACEGPQATAYGYGDVYNSATCNGIDTFGLSGFHLLPTGELPGCRSGWGAFDMNGNLWEHVLGGSDQTIRGGAYNCKDSQSSHRCDYVPGDWTPSARGFRCCVVPDASAPDGAVADTSVSDAADAESGCVAEDGSVDAADASDDAADAATDAVDDAPTDAVKDVETGVDACSADMVRIREFCMDRYEASRSDATSTSMGTLFIATSRAGVLPWFPVDLTTARAACAASGKRLCALDEWVGACSGADGTAYSYGNSYDPTICNGIDATCDCGGAACGQLATCPYPHCFNQASPEGGGPCGASFHVMPTGSFPSCHSSVGVFDMSGNVWELADTQDGVEHFRGGAYNCADSEALHRCDHDGTWGPSAKGFRCCKDSS